MNRTMNRQEVDYWLGELEADYRAASATGNYRKSQIHDAIQTALEDRSISEFESLRDYYLKLYFMMMIVLIVAKFIK